MWLLSNKTPFRAERTWVRDSNGAEIWLVAVRAVFDVHPDGSVSRGEQEDVVRVPQFVAEPDASPLVYDSDLVRTKVATDVVLHGHAYAPNGRPLPSVDVRMTVGTVQKTLRVHGDRTWRRGLSGVRPSSAAPFVKQPISYTRAFGGVLRRDGSEEVKTWEPRNPIGLGCAHRMSDLVDRPVANLEHPNHPIVSGTYRPAPACYAPIPQAWSPRREWAGTYDQAWLETRQPLLPRDFDDRHYQCAPVDQQVPGFLRGGEDVELVNLHPSHPVLRFRVPRFVLGFTTYFSDGEVSHHRGTLHSLILEPDRERVILVWHTALPCHPKVLKLRETVVRVKQWRA